MFRSYLTALMLSLSLVACGGSDSSSGSSPTPAPTPAPVKQATFATAGANDVVVGLNETKDVNIKANTEFTISAPGQTSWSFHWEPANVQASASSKQIGGDIYTAKVITSMNAQYIVKVAFTAAADQWATIRINVTP